MKSFIETINGNCETVREEKAFFSPFHAMQEAIKKGYTAFFVVECKNSGEEYAKFAYNVYNGVLNMEVLNSNCTLGEAIGYS